MRPLSHLLISVLLIACVGLWGCFSDAPPDQQATLNTQSISAPQLNNLYDLELLKVAGTLEIQNPGPVEILASGGPDTFGYTWVDSDDPAGPSYDWVDISAVGTPVPFSPYTDDGTVGPLPIGFNFPFYGNTFSEMYVCSNGFMSFTNGVLRTYTNQPLPNSGSSVPENMLAPLWDDMVYDEGDGNSAFYYNDGSRFILQMYVRRIAAFTPPYYLFQVILYPNGTIVYQYHTLGTNVTSCTIGIQNGDKTDGLTVVHNGAYLHETLAIRIAPPTMMTIDIKPGSIDNAINPKSNGVIPVAILSTPSFDALEVDPSTILFGPGYATIVHKHPHVEDVNMDGLLDMVVHFRTQETGIHIGDGEACLTATLVDGTDVQACDHITTVPQNYTPVVYGR